MTTSTCPPDVVLRAFHVGDLGEADADAVSRHSDGCPTCEARLTALDAEPDTLAVLLRNSTTGRAAPTDAAAAPEYVGGYQLLDEIGRGGMGVVYKARHAALNRLAAVKMIVSGRYATVEDQIRFRLEAEVLARLQHPNIVQVFEAGRHGQQPFLALEWVDGGTVQRLVRDGGVPPREAADLAERIARAVHFAHTCGVLHRDLKPANVLLAADGTPKVTDFGLAKLLDGGDDRTGLTATGSFLGTPNYMAPEQARSGAVVGPPADVYAVGAVLFALITGRPPFQGQSLHEVVLAVLDEPAPPVSRVRAGVPRDLATICARCLEKDPARRYASAADLADDLRRWLDGRPIVARPVPFWERAWLAARRRPAVAGLLAVAALALVSGAAVAGWQWWEAVGARFAAENRERQAVAARKEADDARTLAELREARRAVEKGLLLCDRWDVATGLEWLGRGLRGAERGGDAELARVARANVAAWSARLPVLSDAVSREPLGRLPGGFTPAAHVVAYSRSGEYLATAGNDMWIDLWRVSDGKLELRARRPIGPIVFGKSTTVRCLRFSPADEFTLAIGIGNGFAGLLDVNPDHEPRLIRQFPHPQAEVWSVAFSPDGQTLLTGCDDGIARAWPLAGGPPTEFTAAPKSGLGGVQAVAFVPPPPSAPLEGPLVLTAGRNFGARLWRASGAALRTVGVGNESVYSVAAAWDRDRLRVLVGADRSAQIWQMTWQRDRDGAWGFGEPVPLGPQMSHTHRVTAVAFTPDGRVGMTADHGGTLRVWDVESGRPLFQPARNGDELRDAALLPDAGAVAVCGSDGAVRLWRLPPLPWAGPTISHGSGVLQAYFAPNGELVTASASSIRAWGPELRTPRSLWTRVGSDRSTAVLAVTPGPRGDGFFIAAVGGHENRLAAPGGGGKAVLFPHSAGTTAAAFTPDGRGLLTVYSGFESGQLPLRRWDLRGGRPEPVPGWGDPSVGRSRAAAFRPPAGREVLVGTASSELVWLDADTGRVLGNRERMPAPVNVVGFRTDGSAAVAGCLDGSVRCWAADSRTPLGPGFETGAAVRAVVFSPDGSGLVTGLANGLAQFWDVATGLPVGPAMGHQGMVNQVFFEPNGRSVWTASGDGSVRVWSSFAAETR